MLRRSDGGSAGGGAVLEAALLDQLEVEAHVVGQGSVAARDEDGHQDQVVLVGQPSGHGVGGEVRAGDRELVLGPFL